MEELLKQLTKVKIEELDEEATKLFNTIMKVIDERDELSIRIEEAVDTLYYWRKALDADFQNEMLNILKGDNEEDI